MSAVRKADGGRGARNLFHGDDVREVAHRRAAVLLVHRDAEGAEGAELAPEAGWKFVRAVDLGCARRDLLRGEVAHRLAQHVDRLAVVEAQVSHSGWSGRPASIIRVCCMVATCVRSSAYTSARATVSVRPAFTTSPRATSAEVAGARMLILYSTVTSAQ